MFYTAVALGTFGALYVKWARVSACAQDQSPPSDPKSSTEPATEARPRAAAEGMHAPLQLSGGDASWQDAPLVDGASGGGSTRCQWFMTLLHIGQCLGVVELFCTAFIIYNAKCPYYLLLYMQSVLII